MEKIVPGGYGLGFAEGLTVFVALAAIGDNLRVSVREKKGKVAFAEIVEILEPSPAQTNAAVRLFRALRRLRFSADELRGAARSESRHRPRLSARNRQNQLRKRNSDYCQPATI